MTQIKLFTKQKQTHRHRKDKNLSLPKGKRRGGGIKQDQQIQTTIYKMDKQQGPTVQHRELYSVSYNKPYGKEYEYICITESLCYISATNTTL